MNGNEEIINLDFTLSINKGNKSIPVCTCNRLIFTTENPNVNDCIFIFKDLLHRFQIEENRFGKLLYERINMLKESEKE